jgi:hypothetical protein
MTIGKARADPTKAFFVRMLTRDISLDDCILDLVDNSIDGAWKQSGHEPSSLTVDASLEGFRVDLEIDEERFRIADNCGGITLDDAVEYAFTFGRREEQKRADYSVGVYGIGMKRAVFKLGRSIEIASTYQENGSRHAFLVPIQVDDWLAAGEGSWDFDIEEHDVAAEAGVEIVVTELNDDTAAKFADPTYTKDLRRTLARDYMVPLMRGLKISVDGDPVAGWQLELLEGQGFAPMRHRYHDEGVDVEIVAGMASPPPDDRDPDEGRRTDGVSGWYVLCNGRVVLAADTTSTTGWGGSLPKWHKQYSGFAGAVFFSSQNPELLPMTTTKRSVDVSSAVYRRALTKMHDPARAWIDYTNARKAVTDEVRPLEAAASKVDLFAVADRSAVELPAVTRPATRQQMANVNYAVPLSRMRQLAAALGDRQMSYRDVGLASFDYAFDELADEDE